MAKRRLKLINNQSPGDLVALSAALRDLHRAYPGQFETDVLCNSPEIFAHNHHITPLEIDAPGVETILCEYPAVQESNQRARHFLEAFIEDLNEKLGLDIALTEFRGDIHLCESEKNVRPSILGDLKSAKPIWIVVAGGKFDFTIKWWHFRRWQAVVDHFQDRVQFVQVGVKGDYHPRLKNVLDLRGKTSLRELIALVYHVDGVLCPVTAIMHLAAAVENRKGPGIVRPCVVVGGAREPVHWAAYSYHQYLHTIGSLDCCATGACWRSRTVPLNDGTEHDQEKRLCVNVSNHLPKCMDLIQPGHVIERLSYFLA